MLDTLSLPLSLPGPRGVSYRASLGKIGSIWGGLFSLSKTQENRKGIIYVLLNQFIFLTRRDVEHGFQPTRSADEAVLREARVELSSIGLCCPF